MNPDWGVKLGLDEGIAEVNGARVPLQSDRQHQEDSNGAPQNNLCMGIEFAFLEITMNAIPGLQLQDCTIRPVLAVEDPCSGWVGSWIQPEECQIPPMYHLPLMRRSHLQQLPTILGKFTVSAIASLKVKVSRSELDALNTKGMKKPFSW